MKRSLKFLAGALAAVTVLSSAMTVAVSAKTPVYSANSIYQSGHVTTLPGINTEFYSSFDTCVAEGFVNCHKHNCWWWTNLYCNIKDFSGLVQVQLSSGNQQVTESKSEATPKSSVPWAAVRKITTPAKDTTPQFPGSANANSNNIYYGSCLMFGGKYYPSNMVDLSKFFENCSYSITMNKGQIQLMNADYKMYSTNTNIVRVYHNGTNQVMEAVDTGTSYVYFYTKGGVPFLRLTVSVRAASKTSDSYTPIVDIKPAQWNLSKVGDSTKVSVYATKAISTDIKLKVVYGSATINGDIVTANSSGPIILCAYSASDPIICGYAVLYVGQYTSAVIDGGWKPTSSGICGTIWNPNLWCEDGYTVCGWIEVNGIYIPVIKECKKPDITIPSTGVLPSRILTLNELITMCQGNLEMVLEVITIYKENGFSYYYNSYAEIIKNILKSDSVLSYYYLAQLS